MSKTKQLAIGGIFSALSIMLMFMSSFMPLTYLWVMLSGFVIMVIVIESGRRIAFLAYFVVALMSFILLPNIVIIMEFALLIGYYPIIKMWLDNIGRALVRMAIKLVIFLVFSVVILFISVQILGIAVIFGQAERSRLFYMIPIGQITIFCIAYDYVLKSIHQYYVTNLQPKIFQRRKP